jgi:hypothetical protein
VGETETLVLGELNPPKNSKIPQRNLEIVNGGLEVALTVVLERREVGMREMVKEYVLSRRVIPAKTG